MLSTMTPLMNISGFETILELKNPNIIRKAPTSNKKAPIFLLISSKYDIDFSQFLSQIKLIIISLNTIPGISRIHGPIAVTGSCVKVPCEISFCIHAITLLKEKLASSISQAISFFGVLYYV